MVAIRSRAWVWAIGALLVASAMADDDGRPCGFKIAPCPAAMTCSWSDPACPLTRGENCPGQCAPATTSSLSATATSVLTSSTTTSAKSGSPSSTTHRTRATRSTLATVTRITSTKREYPTHSYDDCGGKRIKPKSCATGYMCVDDPYRGGCGMACDAPGICVQGTSFCGGFAGLRCEEGKMCIDDPRDSCEVSRGGRDCGGICV